MQNMSAARGRVIVRWVLFIVLIGILAGCGTTNVIQGASPVLLEFLADGHTTRETVVLSLGQPSASFDQDSILTYRIGEHEIQGMYPMTPQVLKPWDQVRYSLVLVFDSEGVLQKHRLVPVQ